MDVMFQRLLAERLVLRNQVAFYSDQVSEPEHGENVNALQIAFNGIRSSTMTSMDYSHQPEYVAFKERVWTIRHPDRTMPSLRPDGSWQDQVKEDNEEFSVTVQKETLVCPITQLAFVDPVRSLYFIYLLSLLVLTHHFIVGHVVMHLRNQQLSDYYEAIGTFRVLWLDVATLLLSPHSTSIPSSKGV